MEKLRIGITVLGMFVGACVLILAGGVIEKRTKLSSLATWIGIIILAAILAFVIYAALVLYS
ncbi:MAG: hypothetical protein Q8P00_01905 [Dehalococcoidia bacterium]|nr:hypothetical protein [Dehalococcoidia bacterium]